jgi:hypothetical protein
MSESKFGKVVGGSGRQNYPHRPISCTSHYGQAWVSSSPRRRRGEGGNGEKRESRKGRRTHCLTPAFASLLAFMLALTVANVKGSAVQNLRGKASIRQRRRKGRGRNDEPTPSPNSARHEGRLAGELPVLSDFGRVDARVGVVVAARGGRSSVFVNEKREKGLSKSRKERAPLPEHGSDLVRDRVGEFGGDNRVGVVIAGKGVVFGGKAEEHCEKKGVSR